MAKAQKGSAFEREICKQLSLKWTNNERDDIFWRTAGSGARATTRSKTGKETFGQYGDIQAVDPIGQPLLDIFTFELKRGYNNISIQDLLDKPSIKTSKLFNWIMKAEEDRVAAGSKAFAIIWKRDRRIPIVITPQYSLTYDCWPIGSIFLGPYYCDTRGGNSVLFYTLPKFVQQINVHKIREMTNSE